MTVEVHNPEQTESKPLNTELETLAPETTAEPTELSPETHTPRASDAEHASAGVSAPSGDHNGAGPSASASSPAGLITATFIAATPTPAAITITTAFSCRCRSN